MSTGTGAEATTIDAGAAFEEEWMSRSDLKMEIELWLRLSHFTCSC
jgi:hypothetical protein